MHAVRILSIIIILGCGKLTYGGLSGVITSPNYPKGYTGTSCTYLVYPVSSLALAFQSFDLEPFIDSSYGDYVRVCLFRILHQTILLNISICSLLFAAYSLEIERLWFK